MKPVKSYSTHQKESSVSCGCKCVYLILRSSLATMAEQMVVFKKRVFNQQKYILNRWMGMGIVENMR